MNIELADTNKRTPIRLVKRRQGLLARLFAPVDIASLAFFRVAFGAVMLWEVWRYFNYGWISRYYIEPGFHFTYYGFDWVRPWPGDGMYYHFFALGLLAACIMAGFLYRLSATLFFLGFSYVFLLEQARYLNHFYLVALISLVLIFVPAHRALSLDSLIRPALRSETVPAWALWLVRAQLAAPYIFGGIAKLNPDWLAGEPIRTWLAARTDFPVIGSFFTQEWMVYLFAYGGLLLDLLVVPALLWRRTRPFAIVAAFAFHLTNNSLFHIGIFPWFMMAGTLMFLPPHWPRFFLRVWKRPRGAARLYPQAYTGKQKYAITCLLGLFMAYQVIMPLRNHLYPGDVAWTEQGHRFSWRMKLRDKEATAVFYATDPVSGRTWKVRTKDYLQSWQKTEMESRPDMILQFAQFLAADFRRQGYDRIQVRAQVMASLNGRPDQLLIDPNADLAAQPQTLMPAAWILPLDGPRSGRGVAEK
jgi:vitamin K-dependent gamma-carboxylase